MQNAFRLQDWIVWPQRSIIESGDETVHLKPKSMAVLERLALSCGDVVSREELFESVWPGSVVSDDALTQCIVELRKAFGDTARDARFIETIPKKGFRLVPKVLPLPQHPGGLPGGEENQVTAHASITNSRKEWWPHKGVPVLAVAVFVSAIIVWYQYANPPEERNPVLVIEDTPSLAVLPFADLSPEEDQEYFADGIAEELLNRLSELEGLNVTGRTSSFHFKGKDASVNEIGETLGVGHVLEGSVRKTGEMLRITTQLVNTTNGFQVWSETYDRPEADIFSIQDDISESVAAALSINLGVGELGRMPGGTSHLEAYHEVLKGNSLYRQFTRESVLSAIEHFRRATEIDPDYALAWERLSDIYSTAVYAIGEELAEGWRTESKEALDKANNLAPDAPWVRNKRDYLNLHLSQWRELEESFEGGAGIHVTSDHEKINNYSVFLGHTGSGRDSIPLMERSVRLNPLSGPTAWYLGHYYLEAGYVEQALAELDRAREFGQLLPLVSHEGVFAALLVQDKAELTKWVDVARESDSPALVLHEQMLILVDDPASAIAWIRENEEMLVSKRISYIASVWAAYFGDPELSAALLSQSSDLAFAWNPLLSDTRQTDEFKEFVRDVGLVDYWREFGWGEYCKPVGEADFECF